MAQNIPSKLLKKVNVVKDEFDGSIKYESKLGGVYILAKDGSYAIRWHIISIENTPIGIEKIQLLVNGNVTDIKFTAEEFKSYSKMTRVPQSTFSGVKMAVTYVDKEVFHEVVDIDASEYIDVFNSMNKEAKLKYSGDRDVIGVIDKKRIESIKDVVALYSYLKNNEI
jgi:hypothetical protein